MPLLAYLFAALVGAEPGMNLPPLEDAARLPSVAPSWRTLSPGVDHLHLRVLRLEAELLRFDLAKYRVDVALPGQAAPRTAADLRTERGSAAVVNGGFFDVEGRPLGLRIRSGATVQALRPRVDWGVLVVRADRAEIVHSRDFRSDPTIRAALQVGPRLVVEGRPLKLKPQTARRTAVALPPDGRSLTLVVTRGAVEAQRLADALAGLGFAAAMMLDGGPSTQLSAAVGSFRLDLPGAYPVPDALVVELR